MLAPCVQPTCGILPASGPKLHHKEAEVAKVARMSDVIPEVKTGTQGGVITEA